MSRLRVLIVDDHQIVAAALRQLVNADAGMETVGVGHTSEEALRLVRDLGPDVVLMDKRLGGGANGIEVSGRIQAESPRTGVVMLSGELTAGDVDEGMAAGIRGFLLKGEAADEFKRALQQVGRGEGYLSPAVCSLVIAGRRQLSPPRGVELLTARERDVLKLTGEGMRLKEIASELNIALKTVETHRANLLKKLDCSSGTELTRVAIREGICHV